MADESERSESGSPIYRHQAREREFELAIGDGGSIEKISEHIEKHIGPIDNVFHEIVSDLVHVDVHMVKPSPKRNYYALVTSGMSDRAMTVPEECAEFRFAEIVLCLPPDWPLTQEDMADEKNYWPIRWMKMLARLPHEYQTWLFVGHTVPNGDPPEPFADNTKLSCALLLRPILFEDDFQELTIDQDKTIHFLSFVPLYKEEMDFKLKNGLDPLLKRLAKTGMSELLDVKRPNGCKKKFGFF